MPKNVRGPDGTQALSRGIGAALLSELASGIANRFGPFHPVIEWGLIFHTLVRKGCLRRAIGNHGVDGIHDVAWKVGIFHGKNASEMTGHVNQLAGIPLRRAEAAPPTGAAWE